MHPSHLSQGGAGGGAEEGEIGVGPGQVHATWTAVSPGGKWKAQRVPIVVVLLDDSDTQVQLLRENVKRFRGGPVFKAHRLVHHSTLDLRVIKKKKKCVAGGGLLAESTPVFVFSLLTVCLASPRNLEILPELSRVFESVFDFSAKRQTRLAR